MFATLLKNARNMVLNIVGKPPNKRHSRYRESTPPPLKLGFGGSSDSNHSP